MSLMMDGWMPSVGSSSTISLGRMTRARAIASCCCWPPDRSPPRRPSMDLSTGSNKSSAPILRSAPRQAGEAGLEILLHRQQGEYLAALGTKAMPRRPALVGAHAGDVLAVEQDLAAADGLVADDGAQQRALAHAVAAQHAGDLAALGR